MKTKEELKIIEKKLELCPFCNEPVSINFEEEFYQISHVEGDKKCPLNNGEDLIGALKFDSIEELVSMWNVRTYNPDSLKNIRISLIDNIKKELKPGSELVIDRDIPITFGLDICSKLKVHSISCKGDDLQVVICNGYSKLHIEESDPILNIEVLINILENFKNENNK